MCCSVLYEAMENDHAKLPVCSVCPGRFKPYAILTGLEVEEQHCQGRSQGKMSDEAVWILLINIHETRKTAFLQS